MYSSDLYRLKFKCITYKSSKTKIKNAYLTDLTKTRMFLIFKYVFVYNVITQKEKGKILNTYM